MECADAVMAHVHANSSDIPANLAGQVRVSDVELVIAILPQLPLFRSAYVSWQRLHQRATASGSPDLATFVSS